MSVPNISLVDRQWQADLRGFLRRPVCVVGVGNRMRGDDAAGCQVIDLSRDHVNAAWLDAGVAPENYAEAIARKHPKSVLIIDAVCFGGAPGECRLCHPDSLEAGGVSTHCGSLQMLSEYLQARAGARVAVLAIQPATVSMGCGLSPAVEAAVETICCYVGEILNELEDSLPTAE